MKRKDDSVYGKVENEQHEFLSHGWMITEKTKKNMTFKARFITQVGRNL